MLMAKQNYVWVYNSLGQSGEFWNKKKSRYYRSGNIEFEEKNKEQSEFLDCKDIQVWRLLYYVILWNIKALTFIWSAFCLTGSVL